MMYSLGKQSIAKLDGVHPDLERVVRRAIEITAQDFSVAEGVRSVAQAQFNAAAGTGVVNSLHIRQPDGYAHAVDLWPLPLDWRDIPSFERVASAMFQAADELNVLIQWGADWDMDGTPRERGEWDHPHYQMPQPHRREAARIARVRRMGERAAGEERVL
jgi:peptidoglycan L-alanyl-D-glutamate endopeptidase CwlK